MNITIPLILFWLASICLYLAGYAKGRTDAQRTPMRNWWESKGGGR